MSIRNCNPMYVCLWYLESVGRRKMIENDVIIYKNLKNNNMINKRNEQQAKNHNYPPVFKLQSGPCSDTCLQALQYDQTDVSIHGYDPTNTAVTEECHTLTGIKASYMEEVE